MAARLDGTAERLGVDFPGRDLLRRAYHAAMAPRIERRLGEHDPDFLHPARTPLILMDDAAVRDARVLASAALAETREPGLRAFVAELPGLEELTEVLAEVPGTAGPLPSDDADLLERLVVASPGALLVAVAERLDHARHLHLRPRDEWAPYHRATCEVYAPAAARAHARLEQRLGWWCATFRDRYLTTR